MFSLNKIFRKYVAFNRQFSVFHYSRVLGSTNKIYLQTLVSLVATLSFLLATAAVARTIYVSPTGDNKNNGLSESEPIRTLTQAKSIAEDSSDNSFTILLQGGVTHNEFDTEFVQIYSGSDPEQFAFVWDIDKALTISTYGSSMYARLDGADYDYSDGEPTIPLLVYEPSRKNVLIENIFFENWQEGTIRTHDTENVHIRNIDINNIGTRDHPDPNNSSDPGKDGYPYVAGVIYPKNSNNILIENVVMTNCHNIFVDSDGLHGFYMTRLSDSTIRDVYMRDVSGSPFKAAREEAQNINISNIQAYWTGTTNTHGSDELVQPGFFRHASKSGDGCPTDIVIENSTFWYPYCWDEYEDCSRADGQICSASGPDECGGEDDEICDGSRPDIIDWINTDLRTFYVGEDSTVPPIPNISGWRGPAIEDDRPTNLAASIISTTSVLLNWKDNDEDEAGFIIERSSGSGFTVIATVGENTESYEDSAVVLGDSYRYRVKAYDSTSETEYSNEVSITITDPDANDLPWKENFTLADGTTRDDGPTAWSTEYRGTGTFAVRSNTLTANNTDREAIWTSEAINITGQTVSIMIGVDSEGGLDGPGSGAHDWLDLYYSVDDGPLQLIAEFDGLISSQAVNVSNISGSKLVVTIKTNNTASSEYYYVNKVQVTSKVPAPPSGDASFMLEAESGVIESPMEIKNNSAASGGKHIEVADGNTTLDSPPSDGFARYSVDVKAGTYALWGKVHTPSGGDDSFWVQVNGGTIYKWNKIPGGDRNFEWVRAFDSDNDDRELNWSLTSGKHTITIYYREDGTRLDKIYFTSLDDRPSF